MNRAIIERPFPADAVKTRQGAFGQVSYVEGSLYIDRLNEAFDSAWSWSILGHEERGNEVVVHGVLKADGIEKHAFGGSNITTNRETGEVISLADDLKAAATDALKKACSLLGIGRDLYRSRPEEKAQPRRTRLQAVPNDGTGPGKSVTGGRLTGKQLKFIYSMAHSIGLTDRELRDKSLERFGVVPQYLTKSDASAFIDELQAAA